MATYLNGQELADDDLLTPGEVGQSKACSTCRELLPLEKFGPHRRYRDGKQPQCRDCKNARARERYQPAEPRFTLPQRVFSKVEVGHPAGCWWWTGATRTDGYGVIGAGTRVEGLRQAHRVVYELLVAVIPPRMQIDHLCRNPRCVNPDHLQVVTQAENLRRGYGMSARWARRSACHLCGRPFDSTAATGHRQCGPCVRERARRSGARRSVRAVSADA